MRPDVAMALCLAFGSAPMLADEAPLAAVPPLAAPRLSGGLAVDGDLSDAAWQQAARIETFYETVFSDNRPPKVKTTVLVGYDERYFYVGLICEDPEPRAIRAPFADRDTVFGDQDNVAVFLDTRNDRRSAFEFRVNPRGIQGDAIFNDANFDEDFSPDFYYDTAARITESGWQAEMRIPLSSLRYPKSDPQSWGIWVWRNYPRDFRYAIYSAPIPRGSNCYICHAHELNGLTGLPSSSHFVLAPYVSGQDVASAPEPGAPLGDGETEAQAGLDVKWNPSAGAALDFTLNPDFSQVEADVAQIAVNNRFALFFPEKRPFFLEGVDLFGVPFQAVYTRTITSPDWGGRLTGKLGSTSYTLLAAKDAGGGSVIVPGPYFSDLAPQDSSSYVGIARVRRDLGGSFVGALFTGRELDGGGYNRLVGPDFQWRPSGTDSVTGQLLWAWTETPEQKPLDDHAAHLAWTHSTRTFDAFARYRDVGDGFRADMGFVPQVGYRELETDAGWSFFPGHGLFSRIRPDLFFTYAEDRTGAVVNRRLSPGVNFQGRRNLQGFVGVNLDRVGFPDRVLSRTQLPFFFQVDPSRRLTRITLNGYFGEEIDFAGGRTGRGGSVRLELTLRPTSHLTLLANGALDWLNVDPGAGFERLFTARVARLKATYNFSARFFLRLIGQHVSTRREPAHYPLAVRAKEAQFSGSGLVSYRLNWQTALYLGYGDDRETDLRDQLRRTGRQLFFKLSYSFQR